jgi:hypothetical protein
MLGSRRELDELGCVEGAGSFGGDAAGLRHAGPRPVEAVMRGWLVPGRGSMSRRGMRASPTVADVARSGSSRTNVMTGPGRPSTRDASSGFTANSVSERSCSGAEWREVSAIHRRPPSSSTSRIPAGASYSPSTPSHRSGGGAGIRTWEERPIGCARGGVDDVAAPEPAHAEATSTHAA